MGPPRPPAGRHPTAPKGVTSWWAAPPRRVAGCEPVVRFGPAGARAGHPGGSRLVVVSLVDLVRAPQVTYMPKWGVGLDHRCRVGAPRRPGLPPPGSNTERGSGPSRRREAAREPAGRPGHPALGASYPGGAVAVPVVPTSDHRGDPLIETVSLTRDYGGTGLFDVDLSIPRGASTGSSARTARARRRCCRFSAAPATPTGVRCAWRCRAPRSPCARTSLSSTAGSPPPRGRLARR